MILQPQQPKPDPMMGVTSSPPSQTSQSTTNAAQQTPSVPSMDPANRPQTTGPTSYTPSSNALVSEQLNKLLSKDSDYIQVAKTNALQSANRRGLANSSIAAGEGVLAATKAALPIAQQDAGSYFTAERDNNQTANQFTRDDNQFNREIAQTQYRGVLDAATQQRDQQFRSDEAATDRKFRSGEAQLDRQQQRDLQTGDQTFRAQQATVDFNRELERLGVANRLQQSNVPMTFATNIAAQLQDQVSRIMSDKELSVEAKQNAVTNLVNYSNATMAWAERFYGGTFQRFTTPSGSMLPVEPVQPVVGPIRPAPAPPSPGGYGDGWHENAGGDGP